MLNALVELLLQELQVVFVKIKAFDSNVPLQYFPQLIYRLDECALEVNHNLDYQLFHHGPVVGFIQLAHQQADQVQSDSDPLGAHVLRGCYAHHQAFQTRNLVHCFADSQRGLFLSVQRIGVHFLASDMLLDLSP